MLRYGSTLVFPIIVDSRLENCGCGYAVWRQCLGQQDCNFTCSPSRFQTGYDATCVYIRRDRNGLRSPFVELTRIRRPLHSSERRTLGYCPTLRQMLLSYFVAYHHCRGLWYSFGHLHLDSAASLRHWASSSSEEKDRTGVNLYGWYLVSLDQHRCCFPYFVLTFISAITASVVALYYRVKLFRGTDVSWNSANAVVCV